MKIYKAFLKQRINGRVVSDTVLIDDFDTINKAKVNARNHLINSDSGYMIREYDLDKGHAIIGGPDFCVDTGICVYEKNYGGK